MQWGQNDSEKGVPPGVIAKPPAEYTRPLTGLAIKALGSPDPYAAGAGFVNGWPIAYSRKGDWANLAHCYGSVGVGRDLSPDTGTKRRTRTSVAETFTSCSQVVPPRDAAASAKPDGAETDPSSRLPQR